MKSDVNEVAIFILRSFHLSFGKIVLLHIKEALVYNLLLLEVAVVEGNSSTLLKIFEAAFILLSL